MSSDSFSEHGKSATEIIQQINAKNTKILACILVIGFIVYHGLLHWRYGIDSCKWLLSDGRFKGNQEWQPYGCMMHHYSQTDTRRCLRYLAFWGEHSHFVFIGDSRIRQLYLAFLEQVEPQDSSRTTLHPEQMHSDMAFTDAKLRLRVEFVWSTFVSQIMVDEFRKWKNEDDPPNVIVAGNALWSIRASNASVQALEEYKNNLTYLAQAINTLSDKTKTQVLWVLQAPVNAEKLQPHRSMITNEQIELYNKAASQILLHSRALLWSSTKLVAQGSPDETTDGIHLGPTALKYDTQMLLNMYCNDHMNFNDGSCCSSAEPYTTLQVVTFSVLGVCFIIGLGLMTRRWLRQLKSSPPVTYTPLNEQSAKVAAAESDLYVIVTSLARMGIIMAYFFLCDRTNFFMKENKYFSQLSFWLPFGYVFTLGLFFTEDSQYTKVLHRDQTDEWKGWMQLVILIYHMTGASRILPIYMHIRVLVSAYLFLSGYGHFCYFWQRGDAGIVRFFQVLFRLNFMTVMLCLCMNRPYQFYYFVPLISFWFLMAYLVLALPPQITAASSETNPLHYLYLVLKMVGLFTVITVLYMSEVFFEKVFVTRPWKALFVTTDDDIHEWWFRWKLDRYSISYGMVFAAAYMLSQRYNLLDDNNHSNLFSRGISLSATLGAVIGLGSYACFSFLCRNKQECNEIHSYTVFVPIVSYIVLRNISGALRTRYSSLFAWFGRISLELFISQYHIWLAADTHGVLVLLPGYPVLNLIITSFIFVCAAHEVNVLTRVLTPYAVPADWRLVLRNVLLFLAVLVPIGIHDGMF
ncbi:N-acetylneuraminate 9-O-acetyltransferase isoform X1 [Schistocerca piceifrons]|uniref:N-acetylneuraminate 9-O-acetyltransferase isoform X1 n=2 Tax=Schistocerca piceifrons TaxID=274613 RepID=UPI001F5EEA88|nr:N-acetylneuraminate 9-O-acetyltransferase isoform X1 [Schistocerca piceifrons]